MAPPFVIVGAGAIGGIVGAHLIRAGHEVLLVDANADHVAAINAGGLAIEGDHAAFTVPARAVTPDRLAGPLHRVLVAVKTPATGAALDTVAPLLADDAIVVAMQNGIGVHDMADRFGAERVVAAAFTFGGYYKAPGTIVFSSPASFRIGRLDGRADARLDMLQAAFSSLQPVEISPNILGFAWAKLVLGAIYFATALVDADVCDQLDSPPARALFAALAGEVADVAEADGVRLERFDGFEAGAFAGGGRDPDGIARSWQGQRDYWHGHIQQRTGVWRDLSVHRRKTEVAALLGPVAARATALGVATPLLRRLIGTVEAVEASSRPLGWALLDELSAGEAA